MTDPDPQREALAAVVALVYPDRSPEWCITYAHFFATAYEYTCRNEYSNRNELAHTSAISYCQGTTFARTKEPITPEQQRITDAYILLFE